METKIEIGIWWCDKKVREINFLTWNTQLYEMGNSINDEQPVKKIDMLTFNIVVEKVKKFLEIGRASCRERV